MGADDISDLKEMVGRIDERTKNFAEKLADLASAESVRAIDARVGKLESDATWIKRSSFIALVTAAVAFIRPKIGI